MHRDVIFKEKRLYLGLTKEKGSDPRVSRQRSTKQNHFPAQVQGGCEDRITLMAGLPSQINSKRSYVRAVLVAQAAAPVHAAGSIPAAFW